MADSLTSTPWHAIFAFLIPEIREIVQMHFLNSSPLDEHPTSIWIYIICSLFYCFAFGYNIKCQIYTPTDATSLNCCVKVAFISGSLAYTSLLSMLVPHSIQPLVFVVWFMLLFIYFNHKEIAEMGENMASYLYYLWTRNKSRASSFYDEWRGNKSGNVATINGGELKAASSHPINQQYNGQV